MWMALVLSVDADAAAYFDMRGKIQQDR
jgi:hypothetical protein